jgi:hypothetical protein
MPHLQRAPHTVTLTIANGAALSDAFDMTHFSMAIVTLPAAWTSAKIGFKVSTSSAGTFTPLYDHDGNIVQVGGTPAASTSYEAPPELAAAFWVKLWSQDGSANDTNQGGARSITVTLKS